MLEEETRWISQQAMWEEMCGIEFVCLTQTLLSQDHAVGPADDLEESVGSVDSRVCCMTNNNWRDPGVSILLRTCSPGRLEHLVIHYLSTSDPPLHCWESL